MRKIPIPIVLLGHKDHGKSTLIGRLLLDSNSIKKTKLEEIKKVDQALGCKFELAHLIDSFKEEREKEMTIDSTRAILNGKIRSYELIDVPGHKELIANMLTGAAGAEVALVVISAEEGIRDQTKRHLDIVKIFNIEQLIIAINKLDKLDYRQDVFNKLKQESKNILIKIGFCPEKIFFVPVSALIGDNVVKKSQKMLWYKGKSLINLLEEDIRLASSNLKNLNLIFPIQGILENILIGKVECGQIIKNQEVLILPNREIVRVISIQDADGEVLKAIAGENIGIVLSKDLNYSRGLVITSLDSNLKITNQISGEMFWIKKPSSLKIQIECGTMQTEGEILEPKEIQEKEKMFYKIITRESVVIEPNGKSILSKLVLKDNGEIIAVGNIFRN